MQRRYILLVLLLIFNTLIINAHDSSEQNMFIGCNPTCKISDDEGQIIAYRPNGWQVYILQRVGDKVEARIDAPNYGEYGWIDIDNIGGPIPQDQRATNAQSGVYHFDWTNIPIYFEPTLLANTIINSEIVDPSQSVELYKVEGSAGLVSIDIVGEDQWHNSENQTWLVWIKLDSLDMMNSQLHPVTGIGKICPNGTALQSGRASKDLTCGLDEVESQIDFNNPVVDIVTREQFIPTFDYSKMQRVDNTTAAYTTPLMNEFVTSVTFKTPINAAEDSWDFGPYGVMIEISVYPVTETVLRNIMQLGGGIDPTSAWILATAIHDTNCSTYGGRTKWTAQDNNGVWHTGYEAYEPYPAESQCTDN